MPQLGALEKDLRRELEGGTFFLHAPDANFRDFAARSMLQLMTEMRVGGQIDLILAKDSTRCKLKGLLEELSNQDWLEAAELLDLLELNC